jgi:hypothetical protein
MARKRRKPDGEKPKRHTKHPADLPDRRAMEAVMQQLVAGLQGQADQDTPLGKAQGLMYRAFEEADEQRRVRLAKDALAICPDCADAYVLLAEHSRSRKEALRLYEQGVAAGERALGVEAFERDVRHFWGVLETRPYMRARQGLAHALWTAGRRDEAVQHLQDMPWATMPRAGSWMVCTGWDGAEARDRESGPMAVRCTPSRPANRSRHRLSSASFDPSMPCPFGAASPGYPLSVYAAPLVP